jgi:hypothetical protein
LDIGSKHPICDVIDSEILRREDVSEALSGHVISEKAFEPDVGEFDAD